MGIELIIFDWSGVISDDRKPVYKANMSILEDYDKQIMSFEEWLSESAMTPVEFFENHGICGNPDELFWLYKNRYDKALESGIAPEIYPDVLEVLKYLKERGVRLAVLSSHPAENLRRETEEYNLSPFFDLISGSSRNKAEGLHAICDQLNVDPKSVLYLGDTIYDIKAAKEAGVHSAGISGPSEKQRGYHSKNMLESEGPEFLLESLLELKEMLYFPEM